MTVRRDRRINPFDSSGFQRPAVSGVLGFVGGQIATRERQQARLVKAVAQPRMLGEVVECAGLIEPEPADPGAPQRGEMSTDAEGDADVTGQRADVGATLAVDFDVHVTLHPSRLIFPRQSGGRDEGWGGGDP